MNHLKMLPADIELLYRADAMAKRYGIKPSDTLEMTTYDMICYNIGRGVEDILAGNV